MSQIESESVVSITRRQFGQLARLLTGRTHKIYVKTKFEAYLLEVEDANFHHNSAVFLPDYEPPDEPSGTESQNRLIGLAVIKACYEHAQYRAGTSALVVGHTDRSGQRAYNQRLSELRAEGVVCVLKGSELRERWAEIADGKHKIEDYQQILVWIFRTFAWPCDPGVVDGKHGTKTNSALQSFQKTYNGRFSKSVRTTGSISKETWGAFFDMYQLGLERLMETDKAGVDTARIALHFLKCPSIGCGEDFPITEDRKENYKNPVDRRVEILFFDPGEEPVLDCMKPAPTCEELYKKKMYKVTPLADSPTLNPTFKLTLRFLGPDHVAKDVRYRCSFELKDKSDNVVAPDALVTSDPYRILAEDNHALKGSETNLLGDPGDVTSRPANYRTNKWDRDIRPAVGLRAEVQHLREGKAFPVPDGRFFVKWEIEDPEEQDDVWNDAMSPARPKTWLKNFVNLFKRDKGNAGSKQDDNATRIFGGGRKGGQKLKAHDVLFKSPFNTAAPSGIDATGPNAGKVPVVPATGSAGVPVGNADVIFFPFPVGGDNYRFKLTLVDKKDNGLPLEDGSQNFVTGSFTYWRKTTIDLLVTFDNVDTNYIKWDIAKKAYKAAFVEVDGPKEIKKYDQAAWKKIVKDYFINTVKVSPSTVNNNSHYNYASFFLPDFPLPSGTNRGDWCWTHGEALAKRFLKEAYGDTSRTSPRVDTVQDKTPGLFVFLCRDLHTDSSALGMYMGDREFFMVTVGDGTVTFVHEMGHALYLRHSLIRFDRTNTVTHDFLNDNWLDHDQGDAIVCAMAYQNDYFGSDGKTKRSTRPVEWHFCSVCALTLRHYDRVRMSADPVYTNLIYQDFSPIDVADRSFGAIPGKKTTMRKNARLDFHALAKAESTVNNSGGPFKKDLSSMKGGRWVSSNSTVAFFTTYTRSIRGRNRTVRGRLRGRNAGTGIIKIHFEISGQKSVEIEVDVTN